MSGEDTYQAVVNQAGQYSVWPEGRAIPRGWREAGKTGSKDECLAYIEKVWVDMTPLGPGRPSRDA